MRAGSRLGVVGDPAGCRERLGHPATRGAHNDPYIRRARCAWRQWGRRVDSRPLAEGLARPDAVRRPGGAASATGTGSLGRCRRGWKSTTSKRASAAKAEQLLVGAPGEEARRHVLVVVERAFRALLAVVRRRTRRRRTARPGRRIVRDCRQDRGQILVGHVQQAVHREHGVERARREVQVQEVHDVSLDALGPAALDHRRPTGRRRRRRSPAAGSARCPARCPRRSPAAALPAPAAPRTPAARPASTAPWSSPSR